MEEIAPLLHARIRGRIRKARAQSESESVCYLHSVNRIRTAQKPDASRSRWRTHTVYSCYGMTHSRGHTSWAAFQDHSPPTPAPLGWRKVGVCFFLKHGEVAVVQLPQRETLYCTLCTFSIPSRNAREYIRVCLKPREKAVRTVPSERNEL